MLDLLGWTPAAQVLATTDLGVLHPPTHHGAVTNSFDVSLVLRKTASQDSRPGGAGLFLEVLINNLTLCNDNFILLQFVDL